MLNKYIKFAFTIFVFNKQKSSNILIKKAMKNITLLSIIGLSALSTSLVAQSNPEQAHSIKIPMYYKHATARQHLYQLANAPAANTHKLLTPHNLTDYVAHYDSTYTWVWDTNTGNWSDNVPLQKGIDIVYDTHNNMLSEIVQEWSGTAWVNYELYSNTYNSNNDQISDIYQTWSGSAWVNEGQYIYTYDVNNNQLSETDQDWIGSAWVNEDMYTYTYNSDNYELTQVYQTWSGSAWNNNYEYLFTYNSNNDETSEEDESGSGSTWTPVDLYTYTYNASNIETVDLYQTWSGSVWVNALQYLNETFDANNSCTNEVVQSWNTVSSSWYNVAQYYFIYNANNAETSETYQTWSNTLGWVNDARYLDAYNADNYNTFFADQTWQNSVWANYLTETAIYDADNVEIAFTYNYYNSTGTLATSGDSIYYYLTDVLGINNMKAQQNNITAYPNPSKGIFTLSITNYELGIMNVEVYNILGEKVYSQPTAQSSSFIVDLNNQPSGVYLYRVISESGTLVGEGKLVVQK
jgi:hypothetical protein